MYSKNMQIGVPWFGRSTHLEAAATFKLREGKPVKDSRDRERFGFPSRIESCQVAWIRVQLHTEPSKMGSINTAGKKVLRFSFL